MKAVLKNGKSASAALCAAERFRNDPELSFAVSQRALTFAKRAKFISSLAARLLPRQIDIVDRFFDISTANKLYKYYEQISGMGNGGVEVCVSF
jgi:hypothetical protein